MAQDKLLWSGFLNGDASSFERLYHKYYAELTAYAGKFSRDEQFVAEVVQDLFVKLWQNQAGITSPDSVRYYLLRALRNTAITRLRGGTKELPVDSWEAFDAFGYDGAEEDGPGERIDLDVLTDRQREAIHLFYYQDLSYEEMARLMNIQVGAAYKLIYRALDTLRMSQRGRLTDFS